MSRSTRFPMIAAVLLGTTAAVMCFVLTAAVQPELNKPGILSWSRIYLLFYWLLPPFVGGYFTASFLDRPEQKWKSVLWAGFVMSTGSIVLSAYDKHFTRLVATNPIELVHLILPFLGATLGGLAEKGLFQRLHDPSRRVAWEYETLAGQRVTVTSPRPAKLLGAIFIACAIAAYAACILPVMWAMPSSDPSRSEKEQTQSHIEAFAYVMALLFVGRVLWTLGARLWSRSAKAQLRANRPPILYLRSFADDRSRVKEGALSQLFDPFGYLLNEGIEHRLSKACRRFGPFVAIGRPDEFLPETGAARFYVPDEHWQIVAEDLIIKARLVIAQCGASAGLSWEMKRISERQCQSKLLLVVPSRYRSRYKLFQNRRYAEMRNYIEPLLGIQLPQSLGKAAIICFGQDGTQCGIAITKKKDIPKDHPLYALLKRLVADHHWQG